MDGPYLLGLKGAGQLLERKKPVPLFQHGIGGSAFYGTLPEHVFDLLQGCGMRLFTMRKWLQSHGKSAMTRAEFEDQYWDQTNYFFLAAP